MGENCVGGPQKLLILTQGVVPTEGQSLEMFDLHSNSEWHDGLDHQFAHKELEKLVPTLYGNDLALGTVYSGFLSCLCVSGPLGARKHRTQCMVMM